MSVPIIRFNSFSEDWRLESISSVISNKSKKYDPIKAIEDLPCIELEHLSQQTGEILDTISGKDQKSIKNIFDENSVLFGKLRPYLRKFARPNFKGVCSSEIWVLKSKKLHSDFLFQYIQTDSFFELTQIQAGSKMPRADWESISKGEIYFPNAEEQTKIASFLSAVDEKISQLTQKHELLSQYKQGMMQKLFSQQIRFKADDGREFGEWEETTLGELFDYANGKSFEAEILENGAFKLITLNSIDIKGNLKSSHKTLSYSDNSLLKNDLIMILSDVAHGDFLGLTAIIPDNTYVLNQRVGRLRSKIDINVCFMRFYINFNQKYFKLYGQGSSQLNLSKGDVLSFPVKLPCLVEQSKIANFLSAIDQKIEVVAQQIEQAKTWKKGLLQQMFV